MSISISPRTKTDIYDTVKDDLTDKTTRLTNFIETSFNHVFTDAFANTQEDLEYRRLATQLSGWVDWAGKTLSEDDLDELGLDTDKVSPSDINPYMDETYTVNKRYVFTSRPLLAL